MAYMHSRWRGGVLSLGKRDCLIRAENRVFYTRSEAWSGVNCHKNRSPRQLVPPNSLHTHIHSFILISQLYLILHENLQPTFFVVESKSLSQFFLHGFGVLLHNKFRCQRHKFIKLQAARF